MNSYAWVFIRFFMACSCISGEVLHLVIQLDFFQSMMNWVTLDLFLFNIFTNFGLISAKQWLHDDLLRWKRVGGVHCFPLVWNQKPKPSIFRIIILGVKAQHGDRKARGDDWCMSVAWFFGLKKVGQICNLGEGLKILCFYLLLRKYSCHGASQWQHGWVYLYWPQVLSTCYVPNMNMNFKNKD